MSAHAITVDVRIHIVEDPETAAFILRLLDAVESRESA